MNELEFARLKKRVNAWTERRREHREVVRELIAEVERLRRLTKATASG